MSEFDGAGATGAGGSVESGNGGTSYGADLAIQSVKDRAFQAMAKPDDATDFIKESREREAEERGEPEVNTPHRKHARAERLQRALEAAKKAEPSSPHQEAFSADAYQEGSEGHRDYEAEIRQRDDMVRATAQYEMRAAEFTKAQPDYVETIQAIFSAFPPNEEIAGALLRSPYGPEISWELANNIDAIEQLNAMPPAQAMHLIAKAEGMLEAQRQMQGQQRPPPRRTTKAPPPIKPPSGGAGAPVDVASLARRDDATDLIRHWRRRAG